MLGLILILVGAVCMFFGVLMLVGWVGGKGRWVDVGVFADRQFLDLYFVAAVLAPLLGGAILIVFGLCNVSAAGAAH